MSFKYRILNLNIQSIEPLILPQVLGLSYEPTTHIQFILDPTVNPSWETTEIEVNPTETIARAAEVGLLVFRDTSIDIYHPRVLSTLDKTFILSETVIPLRLVLDGCIVLHASAVSENGVGKCFVGPSMSGKSTRAALSLVNGHSVLAQDVAVLKYSSSLDTLTILPGCGLITLRSDSADHVSKFIKPLDTIGSKTVFSAPPAQSTLLKELYFFSSPKNVSEAVSSIDLFSELLKATFLPRFYVKSMPSHFMQFIECIFRTTKTFSIARGDNFSLYPGSEWAEHGARA